MAQGRAYWFATFAQNCRVAVSSYRESVGAESKAPAVLEKTPSSLHSTSFEHIRVHGVR
jgi:hypothetical protein